MEDETLDMTKEEVEVCPKRHVPILQEFADKLSIGSLTAADNGNSYINDNTVINYYLLLRALSV